MKVNKTNVIKLIKDRVPAVAQVKNKFFHVKAEFVKNGCKHFYIKVYDTSDNDVDAYFSIHFAESKNNNYLWITYYFFDDDNDMYISTKALSFYFDKNDDLVYSTDNLTHFIVSKPE